MNQRRRNVYRMITLSLVASVLAPSAHAKRRRSMQQTPQSSEDDLGEAAKYLDLKTPAKGDGGKIPGYVREIIKSDKDGYLVAPDEGRMYWWDPGTRSVQTAPLASAPKERVPMDPLEPSDPPEPIPPIAPAPNRPRQKDQTTDPAPSQPAPACKAAGKGSPRMVMESVGQIKFSRGNSPGDCTSSKLANGLVLTNSHCMVPLTSRFVSRCGPGPSQHTYEETPAIRRCYRQGFKAALASPQARNLQGFNVSFVVNGKKRTYACNAVASMSNMVDSDYALLSCPGLGSEVPNLPTSEQALMPGQPMTLATWDYATGRAQPRVQTGKMLKSSKKAEDSSTPVAHLSVKSIPGNSGSAVLNERGEVSCLLWGVQEETTGRGVSRTATCTPMRNVMREIDGHAKNFAERIRQASSSAVRCGGEQASLTGGASSSTR